MDPPTAPVAPALRPPDRPLPFRGGRPATTLLLAGLAVRELLCAWTGHPYDFEVWIRTGHAVAQGLNPYAFWPPVPGLSFGYRSSEIASAAYLPLWPLATGGLFRVWEAVGGGDRFVLYFLLKQPPIAGDLATAYLLYRLAGRWSGSAATARRVLAFWCLFPYTIAVTAVWGQFDALVVPAVLGLFWARGPLARNLLYGVGILAKWISAIFLPLELFAERGGRRMGVVVALAVPVAATFGTFAAFGWGLPHLLAASVSQSHGGGGGMSWVALVSVPPLGPVVDRLPAIPRALSYLWVPAVFAAGYWAAPRYASGRPGAVLQALLVVTTVFLLFRWGLYEQYLLYLFPLALLDVAVFHPGRRPLFLGTIVIASVFLVINNDLGLRFLAPLVPSLSATTVALDSSPVYGPIRAYLLLGLAVVVTATLVQLLRAYVRDEPAPLPWWRWIPTGLRPAPDVRPGP